MKVTDANVIEIFKVSTGLSKSQKRPATGINHQTGFAINPDEVGRGGPVIVRYRSAGTQYLKAESFGWRAMGGTGGGIANQDRVTQQA